MRWVPCESAAQGRQAARPYRERSPGVTVRIRTLLALALFSLAFVSALSARGVQERSPYTITTAENPTLGTYLTDSAGKTLYYSTDDIPGVSNCAGGCEAMWPPFDVDTIRLPPTLDRKDFGHITRNNGRKQVTYQGWPLYYYSRDWGPHDTNGQALYGTWYVVQPALFGPSSK